MKDRVRLVVIGDRKVGKSSLIQALSEERFPSDVPEYVGVKVFSAKDTPDHIQLEIADTKSFDPTSMHPEEVSKRELTTKEIVDADAIILVYDVEVPATFERIDTFWMPFLRSLKIKSSIVLVGNKLDVRGDGLTQERLDKLIIPMMSKYREVETCVECSAKTLLNVADVFKYAEKNVLHPTKPIYDTDAHALRAECHEALCRIFKIVDRDRDGFLSDFELNQFQKYCFNQPLSEEELQGVKGVVAHNVPDGIAKEGMTEAGFIFLHTLFIQRGCMETTWAVLRKFGYEEEPARSEGQLPRLEFVKDYLLPEKFRSLNGQSVELSPQAIYYLRDLFNAQAKHVSASALTPAQLDDLFKLGAHNNPWPVAMWRDAVPTTKDGNITRDGFLSMWNLMVLDDYAKALKHLAILGFDGRVVDPLLVLPRRKRRSRNVLNCLVVGSTGCGKTTVLSRLLEKDTPAGHVFGNYRRTAALVTPNDPGKFLVLTEVSYDEARLALDDNKHRLVQSADAVLVLYDQTSPQSFAVAKEFVGAMTNKAIPVLIAATKADMQPAAGVAEAAQQLVQSYGLDTPTPVVSAKLDLPFFQRIAGAVANPDRYVVMSSTERAKLQRARIFSGVAAAATVGVVLAASALAVRYLWRTYKKVSGPAE